MIDTILLKYIGEGLSIGVAFLVVYFLIPDNFFKGKIISLIIGTIFSTVFIFYAGRFSEIEKNEKENKKRELKDTNRRKVTRKSKREWFIYLKYFVQEFIFNAFLWLTLGCFGIASIDKFVNKKAGEKEDSVVEDEL